MLLCLKVDEIADRAILRIKEGKAPIIAVSNTMESFLDSMTDESGQPIKAGDVINADFNNVLLAALNNTLRYTIKEMATDGEEDLVEEIERGAGLDIEGNFVPESINDELERKNEAKKQKQTQNMLILM